MLTISESERLWREWFRCALCRVSVTLNASQLENGQDLLRLDEDSFWSGVPSNAFRDQLYRFSEEVTDPPEAESAHTEYADFFYGTTKIVASGEPARFRRVVHMTRSAFLAALQSGQHPPEYSLEALGFEPEPPPEDMIKTCAINYLTKNLWHNVVHVAAQGINGANYKAFRGLARHQSDFVADNLSTILLALSYALNVNADSTTTSTEYDSTIVHLLRRNRCNGIFQLRARETGEVESEPEQEWRYRRSIAVYLSGWLLAAGRAAASLSVYLHKRDSDPEPRIVIEVNGQYLSVPHPAYDWSSGDKAKQRTHLHQVATYVDAHYRNALVNSDRLREHARGQLYNQLRLLGVESLLGWNP